MGVPALAVSLASFSSSDFSVAAQIARNISEKILEKGLPSGTLLNVNVPAVERRQIAGVRITRQGKGRYEEAFDKRVDPNNRVYYWLTGKRLMIDKEDDVDDLALMKNYISVTPIQYDLTDYKFLEELRTWQI